MLLRILRLGFQSALTGLLYQALRMGVRSHFNQRIRQAQKARARAAEQAVFYHGDDELHPK